VVEEEVVVEVVQVKMAEPWEEGEAVEEPPAPMAGRPAPSLRRRYRPRSGPVHGR